MTRQKPLSSVRWIYYVSRRFTTVDIKGRTAVTSYLASFGIAFGVMALIVVMSVMNGFQREFIDAILEISSHHILVRAVDDEDAFAAWCRQEAGIRYVTPFYEAQGLMVHGQSGKESAALLRAIPVDTMARDEGFRNEVLMVGGSFDISDEDDIVLGYGLAWTLGVSIGDTVQLLALSGSSDVALLSADRTFTVTGIFYADYNDINATYAFVNIDAGKKHFGAKASKIWGIKLAQSRRDAMMIARLCRQFPQLQAESWRAYNRTFFGALQVEKNMLMLLVFLIFVVVAINIYNSMRRMIYERRQDIAVLSALGSGQGDIQIVFIVKGLVTGFTGAVIGLVLGLFFCVNMKHVFLLLSDVQYYARYFMRALLYGAGNDGIQENPMFRIYASVPARMEWGEIALIFSFGVFAALAASWLAGRHILRLTVTEILHDE